jgi:ABC-2 type transport system permease protein
MRKFLAVVKREYFKVVWTWSFLIGTLMAPLIAGLFAVAPMLIFSIQGDTTRIAVTDQEGRITERLQENLTAGKMIEKAQEATKESFKDLTPAQEEKMRRSVEQFGGSYRFEQVKPDGRSAEQLRAELNERIKKDELDAYLILPPEPLAANARYDFFARNAGDFVTNATIQNALSEAVRSERLARANISEDRLKELSQKVEMTTTKLDDEGRETSEGGSFWTGFIVAMLIYITLQIYGQVILSAVVEEKETRIAEVLFSSARPFELIMGKLVGVGLAGLSQLAIWILSGLALIAFGVTSAMAAGLEITTPSISALTIVLLFVFFVLGFFIYASIFALVGSMVTNVQEGGQFAFPPIMMLLAALYCCFPVIRDPNSTFAFWVSVAPFLAPVVMPVRMLTEMPPLWEVGVAILLNGAAITGLVWLVSRVYRVGMLMYGKRATIPEVWRWIRQS